MAKIIVKTTKVTRAMRTIDVAPGVTAEFNADLEAEIDEKDLAKAAENDESLYLPEDEEDDGNNGNEDEETVSNGESEDESDEEDGDDDLEPGDTYTRAQLESENKSFSVAICEIKDYPEDEWKDLNKGPLVDYVLEKQNG